MKPVSLSIQSTRTIPGEGTDTSRVSAFGILARRQDRFLIRYQPDPKEKPDSYAEIALLDDCTATLKLTGDMSYRFSLQKDKQTNADLLAAGFPLRLMVQTDELSFTISESGGEIFLRYRLFSKDELLSFHQVQIHVKPRPLDRPDDDSGKTQV